MRQSVVATTFPCKLRRWHQGGLQDEGETRWGKTKTVTHAAEVQTDVSIRVVPWTKGGHIKAVAHAAEVPTANSNLLPA